MNLQAHWFHSFDIDHQTLRKDAIRATMYRKKSWSFEMLYVAGVEPPRQLKPIGHGGEYRLNSIMSACIPSSRRALIV